MELELLGFYRNISPNNDVPYKPQLILLEHILDNYDVYNRLNLRQMHNHRNLAVLSL
jgi:hypothetical protein